MDCSIDYWSIFFIQDNITKSYLQNHNEFGEAFENNTYQWIAVLIAFFIILPNFLTIHGIRKTSKKLSLVKSMFIYLSVTDLLMGCSLLYTAASFTSHNCQHGKAANSLGVFSVVIGTGTIFIISVLRLTSLRKPLYIINKFVLVVTIVIQLLIAACAGIMNFLSNVKFTFLYPPQCILIGVVSTAHVFASIILNILSAKHIRKQRTRSIIYIGKQSIQRHQKAVGRLSRVSLVVGICYMPSALLYSYFGCILLSHRVTVAEITRIFGISDWVYMPAVFCPGITSVVYIVWNDRIVKFYKKQLCCCFYKRNVDVKFASISLRRLEVENKRNATRVTEKHNEVQTA